MVSTAEIGAQYSHNYSTERMSTEWMSQRGNGLKTNKKQSKYKIISLEKTSFYTFKKRLLFCILI